MTPRTSKKRLIFVQIDCQKRYINYETKNKLKIGQVLLVEGLFSIRFYLFRSWGRVGTTIGGTKLESFDEREDALGIFKDLYLEKTGNSWRDRKSFVKVAGKFFPMDLDMGEEDKGLKKLEVSTKSSLHPAIQSLVTLIFDVDSMKKALVEFEVS